jgi:hypothetical protein
MKTRAKLVFRNMGEFQDEILSTFDLRKHRLECTWLSPLPPTVSVQNHLMFLFEILEKERKLLKKWTANGVDITCRCSCSTMKLITLEPKALSLAHVMGIGLELKLQRK